MRQSLSDRVVLAAMTVGLVLTVLATVVPFLDNAVLADHVGASYPGYSAAEIDAAVSTYLTILAVLGGLGALAWLGTMALVRTGRSWAVWAAIAVWVVAASIAVAGLTVTDTSGDVGLAPLFGWLLVLPCVPGAVAVVQLWRRRSVRAHGAGGQGGERHREATAE